MACTSKRATTTKDCHFIDEGKINLTVGTYEQDSGEKSHQYVDTRGCLLVKHVINY